MQQDDVVYCFDLGKGLLELVEVGLEDFYLHVVHIVFGELEHSVAQRVGLLQLGFNVALFSRLVLEPHLLEVVANVLVLKQVAE